MEQAIFQQDNTHQIVCTYCLESGNTIKESSFPISQSIDHLISQHPFLHQNIPFIENTYWCQFCSYSNPNPEKTEWHQSTYHPLLAFLVTMVQQQVTLLSMSSATYYSITQERNYKCDSIVKLSNISLAPDQKNVQEDKRMLVATAHFKRRSFNAHVLVSRLDCEQIINDTNSGSMKMVKVKCAKFELKEGKELCILSQVKLLNVSIYSIPPLACCQTSLDSVQKPLLVHRTETACNLSARQIQEYRKKLANAIPFFLGSPTQLNICHNLEVKPMQKSPDYIKKLMETTVLNFGQNSPFRLPHIDSCYEDVNILNESIENELHLFR